IPNVYKGIASEKTKIEETMVNPKKQAIKINNDSNLSASHPPTGRTSVAITIKPAVRKPASTLSNAKKSTKKLGKNTVKATKVPKVIKKKRKKNHNITL